MVDQAVGLLSADVNGLSDPFTKVSLNDYVIGSTRSIRKTLAPKWRRAFHTDVFHPSSVLTVQVVDHDIGASKDDHIGFVDLRLDTLPTNSWIAGWFELRHPSEHVDSIKGRACSASTCRSSQVAGRIRLEFFLSSPEPFDELFAMCLPPPSFGHGFPRLSLNDIAFSIGRISENWTLIYAGIRRCLRFAERNLSIVFALSLFLIWNPRMVLPVSFCIFGVCGRLAGGSVKAKHENISTNPEDIPFLANAFLEEGLAALSSVCRAEFGDGMDVPTASGPGSLYVDSQPGSPKCEKVPSSKEPNKPGLKVTPKKLRFVERFIQEEQRINVRRAQFMLNRVTGGQRLIIDILTRHSSGVLVSSWIIGFILWCVPAIQLVLVQVLATLVICTQLGKHSTLGRVAAAVLKFCLRSDRLAIDSVEQIEDGPSSDHVVVLSECQCRELLLVPGACSHGLPHDFRTASVMRISRCKKCGRLVSTSLSKSPPLRCRVCRQTVCRRCISSVPNDCPGVKAIVKL